MAKSLQEILEDRFGVLTTFNARNDLTTIGTAAVSIMTQDPVRLAFVVMNLSVNTLHVAPIADVSGTRGILVPPNGGSLVVLFEEDLILPALEWFGIAGAAASAVFVIEVLVRP